MSKRIAAGKSMLGLLFFLTVLFCNCKEEEKCDLSGEDPITVYYCKSNEKFSDIPHISNAAISKNHMDQLDSFRIKFSFTDGDGDLIFHGLNNLNCDICSSGCFDTISFAVVCLRDMRTDCQRFYALRFEESINASISGEINLVVSTVCCLYSDGSACTPSIQFPTDTLVYRVKIKDSAGNISNEIETPPVYIECN